MITPMCQVRVWYCGLVLTLLVASFARAEQLPLASVKYFDPYQNPTSWGGWGSSIYQGSGAVVRNVGGAVPVEDVGGTKALVLDSVNPPGGWWNVLFKVSGNSLNFYRTGTNPAVHLRLKWSVIPTNNAWNMNLFIQGAQRPLNAYLTASTLTWQDIYIPASDFIAADPGVDLSRVWLIGLAAAGNHRDHCILNIAALDLVPSTMQVGYTEFAKVNQVGYAPLMATKLGVVSWEPGTLTNPPTSFQIVNLGNSQVVFNGPLSPFVAPPIWQAPGWTLDGDVNYQANFGALRAPGTYRLEVPELGARSVDFVIATNVYENLFRDALRFFYYSRSGVPIVEPHAEGYSRSALYANNTNATYNYAAGDGYFDYGTNTTRDVHGCWFDAGDTHVDVPNTATACWFLLEVLREFGGQVPADGLNLPESTSQQSDLVPLISWGLDWLKRMQNPDGSVHDYVVTGSGGAAGPQEISDVSSFATACAAAIFAKSYAVLSDRIVPAERADLLARAQLCWSWLQAHPNMVWTGDPYWGNATYDRRCRAFAAVELFEATGHASFNDFFVNQFNQNGGSPINGAEFGANQTGYGIDNVLSYLNHALNFAFFDYARSSRAVDATTQATLKGAFLHQADVLTNYTALSGYRIPMLYPGHLYWGSSGGVLAPSAFVLAHAFAWTGNTNYHEAALQALHFICGRNPVNRVFVSGYGDYQHSVDFFSQFWTNLLQQPPGYLGGNINVAGSAQPVVEHPWKRFINTQDADMTEPGVYWNSAFAWVVGYAVQDATHPKLTSTDMPGGFHLSWPLHSTPFMLEQTPTLVPPVTWALVTNSPALSNGTWAVLLPRDGAQAGFYRLRAP